MRLGQLSRLVNKKPTEIISFIKTEYNVELGTHLNTKVEDEWSDTIVKKFKPKPIVKTPTPPVAEEALIEKEVEEIVVAPSADEDVIVSVQEESEPIAESVLEFDREAEIDSQTISNAPLIKAQKIVLEGPKVIGKIDLPAPPAPQMIEIDGVMYNKEDLAKQKREQRKAKFEKFEARKSRSSKNVRGSIIKSEAQIEQLKLDNEAQSLANKIAHREKRIETKRKEAKKPVKVYTPKKAKKASVKPKSTQKKPVIPVQPENLSVFGKIWKWFNT